MKAPKIISPANHRRTRASFNVVIAYEDFRAGKRAMDMCKPLVSLLGSEVQFRNSMWKFDILRSEKLNRIAIGDAIEADIIIVATTQPGDLPEQIKEWVESWVPEKRGQTAALLALMDFPPPEDGVPSLSYNYLEKAAANAGIDFLPQIVQPSGDQEPAWPGVALETSAVSSRVVNRPAPEGWGLND